MQPPLFPPTEYCTHAPRTATPGHGSVRFDAPPAARASASRRSGRTTRPTARGPGRRSRGECCGSGRGGIVVDGSGHGTHVKWNRGAGRKVLLTPHPRAIWRRRRGIKFPVSDRQYTSLCAGTAWTQVDGYTGKQYNTHICIIDFSPGELDADLSCRTAAVSCFSIAKTLIQTDGRATVRHRWRLGLSKTPPRQV